MWKPFHEGRGWYLDLYFIRLVIYREYGPEAKYRTSMEGKLSTGLTYPDGSTKEYELNELETAKSDLFAFYREKILATF